MSRRPAKVTQAELNRAIRAAKQAGVGEVEIRLGDDAAIVIKVAPTIASTEKSDIVL